MDIEITQAAIFSNCMQTDVAYGRFFRNRFKGKSQEQISKNLWFFFIQISKYFWS